MKNLMTKKTNLAVLSLVMASFVVTGCGGGGSSSNPSISGIKYSASYVGNYFVLTTTFQSIALQGGGTFPLGNSMPNSTVSLGPDFQSNGTDLTVSLATADIVAMTGVSVLPPTTLPGGRPLPTVANGSLPGFAFTIPKWDNIALYFGNGDFGVFVPVKMGISIGVSYNFYSSGAKIGTMSLVPEDSSGKNSGFLLLISKVKTNAALAKAGKPLAF